MQTNFFNILLLIFPLILVVVHSENKIANEIAESDTYVSENLSNYSFLESKTNTQYGNLISEYWYKSSSNQGNKT